MPLAEELLLPIPGDNPSGADLRYTATYDNIREARRQDDDLDQGAWQHERKVADYPLVVKLSTLALKEKTKDLQIAAWLTEAHLRLSGFRELHECIRLCDGLLVNFWDTLYPQLEDGDAEMRATPLDWIGAKLDQPLRHAPLTRDGHSWYQYKDSRTVQYEDQAKDAGQKKAREKALAEGKLPPEIFDKSFQETPKLFYAQSEKELDLSLQALAKLEQTCQEKFADSAPSLGKLKGTLGEVRHTVHAFLQKKRETEPDPVEEKPVESAPETLNEGQTEAAAETATGTMVNFSLPASSESAARREVVARIAAGAHALRSREATNPAPYLIMRGLRWGDLRSAAALSDPTMLEAPPTEVRLQVKRLATQEKWKELLDAAESIMALPCSRAWLDLQRFVVEACVALGSDYDAIAVAIRSELRALLRDVPHILNATLMDDTPAANEETRKWLLSLMQEPPENGAGHLDLEKVDDAPNVRWQKRYIDSSTLAKEALRMGHEAKAFDIMLQEINRQRSARGRFQRKLQFIELCMAAGKESIAQPIVDDVIAAIDTHKLEEWEDRSAMAAALITIMKVSKKIQGDAKEKQKYFERICRLDPAQALTV